MSLPGVDLHIRITPDMAERLRVLADIGGTTVAGLAALWLEKTIVGEFHAVTMQADRFRRLGLTGRGRDSEGFSGRDR